MHTTGRAIRHARGGRAAPMVRRLAGDRPSPLRSRLQVPRAGRHHRARPGHPGPDPWPGDPTGEVRICPDERGHIQAAGRDSRGRKQYRYHPRWRSARDTAKFDQLAALGAALPRIRARVAADLARRGLPRDRVLALVVSLLDLTLVRIGNASYAEQNRSYRLTTLRNGHARVVGSAIHLRFRGKSGRVHEVSLRDRMLARLVRRCRELPRRFLFQYVAEDGRSARPPGGHRGVHEPDAARGPGPARARRRGRDTSSAARPCRRARSRR